MNLALTPDPGGWNLVWNKAGTVVTATHAGLGEGMTYTAMVSANDASGNALASLFSWSFTTLSTKYWIYLPVVSRQ